MVNLRQKLFDSYEQLVAIQREQLAIATKDRYDQQLEEIRALESKKDGHMAVINTIRMEDKPLYDEIVSSNSLEITAYLEELRFNNSQIQQLMDGWYGEASRDMKQVSIHRKTLQTYGGVNHSDIISYYFDYKK